MYPRDGLFIQQAYLGRFAQNSIKRLYTTYYLPALFLRGTTHHGTYHGIQTWTIATARGYHHAFHSHFPSSLLEQTLLLC